MKLLHPRSFCASFELDQEVLKKDFKNVNVFSLFKFLSIKMSVVLEVNKLKSPLPKDAWCPIQLKLANWFWRRSFFNVLSVFFAIFISSPFGKWRGA